MDPRLLDEFDRELQHLRGVGAEFAAEYPKIAGRLGMQGIEVADPYVERLLEGFAFLAARVQLKLKDEHAEFTQALLEMVYPHYLAPLPSMAIVQLQPDVEGGAANEGPVVPRRSVLRSVLGKGEQTACQYVTAHDVALWPLEIVDAQYSATSDPDAPAMLRLMLRAQGGVSFGELAVERLTLFLDGADETRLRLHEQLLGHALRLSVAPAGVTSAPGRPLPEACVRAVGFAEYEALLPPAPRSFEGYRLLREFFGMPDRFRFVELDGLRAAFDGTDSPDGAMLELRVHFDALDTRLEQAVSKDDFSLHCTPAINLFEKRCDRIQLDAREHEHHVVVDRTRPMDFELHGISSVTGYAADAPAGQPVHAFYAHKEGGRGDEHGSYYTLRREPRRLSLRQQRVGARSSYVGSEAFLSLADARGEASAEPFRQLAVTAWCTNRDLPLHMPIGASDTDFTLVISAPVKRVRCIRGPTRPRAPVYSGETPWRLASHLSLNYLSLQQAGDAGARAMRELLALYADLDDAAARRQIDALVGLECQTVTRRLPMAGPIAYGRGLEVTLTFRDAGLEGLGAFAFGAVLEHFIARYASINTFTETVVRSADRGEIMRWPVRVGARQTL